MDESLHIGSSFARSDELKARKKKYPQPTLSEELKNVFVLEEIKAEVQFWKKLKGFLRGRSSLAGKTGHFNRICGLCLAYPKEQKLLIKFRKTGLYRLNLYLVNSTRREVQSRDVKLLTWCCLSLLSFYYSKRQDTDCSCIRTNKVDQVKSLFRTAMYLVLPEKQDDVIRHTIRYITLTSQWNSNDYDSYLFQELMTILAKPELLLAKIIKQIEISQREDAILQAFNIACTLSNIMEYVYWDKYLFNHLLHNCFNTLLKVYLLCNTPMTSHLKIENAKFRIVIKTCIRYFITNIKDNKGLVSVMDAMAKCLHDETIMEDDRTEIMDMVALCAQKHSSRSLGESITPDLLDLLLKNLASDNKNLALTSHKVFHYLLDRHGNEMIFSEPVYFFKGRSNFVINYSCSNEDINFIKGFSGLFFDGISHSFLSFTDKYSLVMCYITVCLVLVEVPEPVITINIIRLLIQVQNSVLKNVNYSLTEQAQIHGIIFSLISLICVIHNDEVQPLKKYVEEVIRFRTENSPHLLPPLQNKYVVASHHTTDYYDQLYFMEEEVLYALQRCWLSKRTQGSR